MLQQTTVTAVQRYFLKFAEAWPDVHALSAASLDDVLRSWAGLGYYARARNLHACARKVAEEHRGIFPSSEAELLKLPGIGIYTAAAIAAIAFDRQAAAVDGNVERVISRVFAIESPLPVSKPVIRSHTQALMPKRRAGDFAQALMDLGAIVCTPKNPDCPACPWADDCEGRKRGIAGTLPRRAARKPVPVKRGIAFWIERDDGAVLLRRRPAKGLLGGMMEIPSTDWQARPPKDVTPPFAAAWTRRAGRIEHTFTHFHLELEIWRTRVPLERPAPDGQTWVSQQNLDGEALPSVMRKIVAAMRKEVRSANMDNN